MVQHSYLEQFARDNSQNIEKTHNDNNNAVSQNGSTGKNGHGNVGFSKQQIQELGELFGIRNRADTDNDDHQGSQGSEPPSPPAHRASSDNGDDDLELKMDYQDVSPLPSPARHGMENESESVAASSAFKLSLVQQIKVSGSAPAASASEGLKKAAATAGAVSLCRISPNSCYVAGSAIGSKVITIWTTQKDSGATPASTIRLLSPLTTISWFAAGLQQDQVRIYCYFSVRLIATC